MVGIARMAASPSILLARGNRSLQPSEDERDRGGPCAEANRLTGPDPKRG